MSNRCRYLINHFKKNSKNLKNTQTGISLIELLVCIAMVAILFSITMPALSPLLWKNKIVVSINELDRAISLARSTAISTGKIVTLCKSHDGIQCGGNWNQGFIVFSDQNADRLINGEDQLIRVFLAFKSQGSLKFKAFQNKQYLQMTPLGFTNFQNGNFTFCPVNKDPSLAQQLIVSRTGRTRYAQDLDGDGIREDTMGQPMDCS